MEWVKNNYAILVGIFFLCFIVTLLRSKLFKAVTPSDARSKRMRRKKKFEIDWLVVSVVLVFIFGLVCVMLIVGSVFYHFQVGEDIPLVAIKNHGSAQYWGQIGDFVGGVLNPILSFVALLAVIINLYMQRKELQLAREDAVENQNIQNQQSAIFDKQNFEAVFFKLLDIHSRLFDSIQIQLSLANGGKDLHRGAKAFRALEERHFMWVDWIVDLQESEDVVIRKSALDMMENHGSELGHYFRNIYQILKYIDSYGQDALRSGGYGVFLRVRRAVEKYDQQRTYANMLRAQLSPPEVSAIFLNCLTNEGGGLKYYVEKFSLLKHFDKSKVSFAPGALDFYEEIAYADSEDISPRTIFNMTKKRFENMPKKKT